jgi:hypothetical protein
MLKPKIKKIPVADLTGYGEEPTWQNVTSMPMNEYIAKSMRAINWYYQFYKKKECQEWFAAWYYNNFPKRRKNVKYIEAVPSHMIPNAMGFMYPMELKGWKARLPFLRRVVKITKKLAQSGKLILSTSQPSQENVLTVSIQDRIKEQATSMSEKIDYIIDEFIADPDKFDLTSVNIVSHLRSQEAKAVHVRYIKSFYEPILNEWSQISSDVDLQEAYSHINKKNQKKMLDLINQIFLACDQILNEAKISKKPKIKKTKSKEDQVKKLKFKKSDDKLNISSIPPASLIGANGAVVYNTKNRKIGYYISKNSDGFKISGTTLENFSEKSFQKTLRKPVEQLKEFKDLNTQKKFESWFNKSLLTTEISLNGRFHEDLLILKIFK